MREEMNLPSHTPYPILVDEQLQKRWQQLNDVLTRYEMLWKPTPFQHIEMPWGSHYPELARYILSLSAAEVNALDNDPDALANALQATFPDALYIHRLAQVGVYPSQGLPDLDRSFFLSIPATKALQIQALASVLETRSVPFLEWCSGKGHLTRLLTILSKQPSRCLEQAEQLCIDGRELSATLPWPVSYEVCDVLHDPVDSFLKPQQHAVALHACGHLHRKLLTTATQQQVGHVSVAPCCYHIGESEEYQPFSQAAQASDALQCQRDNIRLATREFVTGRPRRALLRQQNNRWRMGFDLLQRDVRGKDEYLTAPSAPRKLLQGTFQAYCQHIARTKALTLPPHLNYDHYEERGNIRYYRAFALELVRSLFRRPLEMWLVLDRAMYMGEQGYHVKLGLFCPRQMTPRNLLIQSTKRSSQ